MAAFKVRLILEEQGKVLLLKQTVQNGGKYTLIGGTVERGEHALEAIIRECSEESGIRIFKTDLTLVHTLHKIKDGDHRVVLYFKAKRWTGVLESREPKKFKKLSWEPIDALPNNISPTIKQVLLKYRGGINYSEIKNEAWK
ncbi:MAG: NUDIX domain-containing protein [Saprospiraceae bacterium]